jgi:hypothetical protein
MSILKREFVFSGDDLFIYDFPEKTRIIYPPDAFPPLPDEKQAIIAALDRPIGAPPLISQVNPLSHVTIAFDDPCLPLPPMKNDPRGLIIEAVVEKLFAAGVKKENITLICAGGLHRKFTLSELSHILGKKIVREFKKNITCHDAEDPKGIVSLGRTPQGEEVEVNRALVESDLVIYANLTFCTMNGGWKSAAVGLSTYNSIRCHHRPNTLKVGSLIDPENSGMHSSISRMGDVIKEHTNFFTVETVLNNDIWPQALKPYLTPIGLTRKRKANTLVSSAIPLTKVVPGSIKRKVRESLVAGYRMIGVHAGKVDEVHAKTMDLLFRQQNITVHGQSDIVVYGVPNFCPYASYSTINPILVVTMAMGYYFNFHRIRPLVKKNGVIIIANPLTEQFNLQHHPSYHDFYTNHLPEYQDPEAIITDLEETYARDQNYIDRYRYDYAYHGVHALLAWYWAAKGMSHVKTVIVAGAREPKVAEKLGLVPAKDMTEAIAKAEEIMGKDASITYHYFTPMAGVDVSFT